MVDTEKNVVRGIPLYRYTDTVKGKEEFDCALWSVESNDQAAILREKYLQQGGFAEERGIGHALEPDVKVHKDRPYEGIVFVNGIGAYLDLFDIFCTYCVHYAEQIANSLSRTNPPYGVNICMHLNTCCDDCPCKGLDFSDDPEVGKQYDNFDPTAEN